MSESAENGLPIKIYSNQSPINFYKAICRLGEGAYARVVKAVHNQTAREVAIKMISTGKLSFQDTERAQREVHIVSILNHPHIIKVYEIYKDTDRKQFHIVQELAAGGDLLDFIFRNGPLPELVAAKLLKGVIQAIHYLHTLGYAHRDLKPENLVLDADHKILKIIDFGFAKSKYDRYGLETPIGTPGWQAYDVMRREPYSLAVDMWSIGCIVYFTLFAIPPFSSNQEQLSDKVTELRELVRIGRYEFPSTIPISKNAKEFISLLLEREPNSRMTAAQALEHYWMLFEESPEETTPMDMEDKTPKTDHESEIDKLQIRECIDLAINRVRETSELMETEKDVNNH
jgi:serine/threonine protein kinase